MAIEEVVIGWGVMLKQSQLAAARRSTVTAEDPPARRRHGR
jgi:hypothetical protein